MATDSGMRIHVVVRTVANEREAIYTLSQRGKHLLSPGHGQLSCENAGPVMPDNPVF